jgi:hypothetical protein
MEGSRNKCSKKTVTQRALRYNSSLSHEVKRKCIPLESHGWETGKDRHAGGFCWNHWEQIAMLEDGP